VEIRYYLEYVLERATVGSSGYDLRAKLPEEYNFVTIAPGERCTVDTGLHLQMPMGVEAQIRSRSGIARKNGVIVLGAPCTIDSDYRGEVSVMLINHGQLCFDIKNGDRIAQLVFAPVYVGTNYPIFASPPLTRVLRLEQLSKTDRGVGGFGSTGVE